MPNFSLQRQGAGGKLMMLEKTYGPFQPNFPVEVPIWLAVVLRQQNKCIIQPPAWIRLENLQRTLNEEKEGPGLVQLPDYYIEVCFVRAQFFTQPCFPPSLSL